MSDEQRREDEGGRDPMRIEGGRPDRAGNNEADRERPTEKPAGSHRAGRAAAASLSRVDDRPQPAVGTTPPAAGEPPGSPAAHVVLYQPEIPQNTGNIGRTCVATSAKLWIVRPTGFRLDERRLRRAGLDYWQHLDWQDVADWPSLTSALSGHRFHFLSRFARRLVWDAEFRPGDVFVFGSESSGLPSSILDPEDDRALRLPTSEQIRSLNLATTVGVVLFEHQRQQRLREAGAGRTPAANLTR